MTKLELEVLLKEFDAALVEAFPGPEPMSALLVGGACLLLQGITTQLTGSVEVIILELLGSQERTLVFHSPTADKVRRINSRLTISLLLEKLFLFPIFSSEDLYGASCVRVPAHGLPLALSGAALAS